MADLADNAQILEDLQRRTALAGITVYEGVSANNCIECDQLIPSERQRLIQGVQTCTSCAALLEHPNR